MTAFAELCATTNFSFLRAGSHPEEMVEQAKALGLSGLGIADRNTLAGVVRAHVAAKEHGVRLIVGARLVFNDGAPDVLAYPKDRAAYARLTRLLTRGNLRAPKGDCWLRFEDLLEHVEGTRVILLPLPERGGGRGWGEAPTVGVLPHPPTPSLLGEGEYLSSLREVCGDVWLAAPVRFDGEDKRRLRELTALAQQTGARLIATTEPLMHVPERRPLLDVVTCIREKTTLANAGTLLAANAERHLKASGEMARLYADAPEAVRETLRFLDGVHFSMEDLRYEYPEETAEGFADPQAALEHLTREGAASRYPEGVPAKVLASLARELAIVAKLKYAPYFLTVADIVRFARSGFDKDGNPIDPILCQGRGSAANSTICYCLGVTEVDPATNELLFDRFVSEERGEPPDIDIDFEHERREEVIQYIYKKYGRDRAGLSAVVTSYRGRSAIREVAKTFGFSEDRINALSKALHWWSDGVTERDLKEQGLDIADLHLMLCVKLARELHGFPRHLSQHVGGFVITREKLHDVVPIQNAAMEDRTVVEWNKDDLEALGILKVDVLGLGMLSCLKKALDLMARCYPGWEDRKRAELRHSGASRSDEPGTQGQTQSSMIPWIPDRDFVASGMTRTESREIQEAAPPPPQSSLRDDGPPIEGRAIAFKHDPPLLRRRRRLHAPSPLAGEGRVGGASPDLYKSAPTPPPLRFPSPQGGGEALERLSSAMKFPTPGFTTKSKCDRPPIEGERGATKAPTLSAFWPPTDERVYAMLHRADSVGVFQVESRAQMSMLPRLRPQEFYDLVIEVAIVRPGPIQGGMVHPYLKRRQGLEKVSYPSKALEAVLKRTLGVPLFQEQAMQIAIVGAGFSPPEADKLRRAMATFKRVGTIGTLKAKFIDGMIANGYARDFAEASFRQIEGFGEYGFPESHAASFALLVYASCWLKCHYPDVFACALLNAQPMGFYAPAQIVRDAQEHGVEVRPIDINASSWNNELEAGPAAARRLHKRHAEMESDVRSTHAMRLGFRQAKGLRQEEMEALVAARGRGYDSVRDVWLRSGVPASTIERLADLDAFRSLGLDRRDALWAARGLNRVGGQEDLPLFSANAPSPPLRGRGQGEGGRANAQAPSASDRPPPPTPSPQGGGGAEFQLPAMPFGEHIVEDYRTLGLSLKAHPCALLRPHLDKGRAIKAETLPQIDNGRRVRASGLVLVRQRPGTASGVIFMTLEDETGIANIVVWPKLFERFRRQVLGGRLVAVDGPVQGESGVIHVIAERVLDWTPLLSRLSAHGEAIDTASRADEPRRGVGADPRQLKAQHGPRHPRNVRIDLSASDAAEVMPKGRNFH